MRRSITKDVAAAANAETVVDVVTGLADRKQRIVEIWPEKIDNLWPIAFLNQDKIVEVGSDVSHFPQSPIPVDVDLPEGSTFKVGFKNESASPLTHQITTFIEELPA